ncbi:S8/S53 family peptidase [Citreimonas sp.]|uniref:S8/S53 family peptidase n=1 Tax=Citreimonas sp. TaxID=3036715 RepID=UPI00405894C6
MADGSDTAINTATEDYAAYPALWHLESIGVLGFLRSGTPKGKRSRVAIIDTSVAVAHPCLRDAVNHDLAIDFFSNRLGAFPYYGDRALEAVFPNLASDIADSLPASRQLFNELVDRLSRGSAPHHRGVAPTTSPDFSNHGTAIAGLVGARPQTVSIDDGAAAGARSLPLPYCGTDPYCEIVPISTNFDTDPESLILALLYAEIIDASVVLLPRAFPDPFRTVPQLGGDPDLLDAILPARPTDRECTLWGELTELVVAVSLRRPVVCAAGNAREANGIYPANLADADNGIISVGAVNAKGQVAGYSAIDGLTVHGPSNDAERHDRLSVRLDDRDADFADRRCPPQHDNAEFSHFDIISTDVPGAHGYSYSPFAAEDPDGTLREFGSYFCRFGGTSAASAIVAGYVSLGYSSGDLEGGSGGLAAKDWLMAHAVQVETDAGAFRYPAWSGSVNFPDLYGL